MTAENWKKLGKYVTINDKRIFVIDTGDHPETLVILHGYPTSSYDYFRVIPELAHYYRIVVHDHLGFGFSDKPDSLTYSLIDQADVALELWRKLGLKQVSILAHDYGTSIAKEILARKNHNLIPLKINKIYLCSSSMRLEHLHLKNIGVLLRDRKLGKYISRLTNFGYRKIRRRFKKDNINYQISKNYDIKDMWNQMDSSEGQKEIHFISNFINERYTFFHRWTNALKETTVPVKIFWQKTDSLAIKEIAIVLATEEENEKLTWVENVKHYSILETPNSWIKLVFEYQNRTKPVF
ncbi:alpha/beta hydrolase [Polaribacter dokdonensis]|uniref:Alpha/beta hydrolase n=1 Tax=Polaribacter dokdonensis DSW-5 TaxID=1300348 RepID=A0A0M9CI97_9FLAO|nr:alpha/beta hydrolase [Polaribacter dokdonensis]KOY52709.1 Alpha/beta hydrolase [Polaribacter dokdonensis DSW-5]SEE50859.1 Pimeloyl-ACP methyl ester carboxylesterase [Polaribacter dokdonensis DSW-5]